LAYSLFLKAVVDGRASNRETVAGWILNSRAASAAVLSPLETIFRIGGLNDDRDAVEQGARFVDVEYGC
jgi:hypothetical protein